MSAHSARCGGLHIEMAAFKLLGDWLDGSGWTSPLVAAEVATGGVADYFIKATHVTRTRWAHQVTATCLFILQSKAYSDCLETLENGEEPLRYTDWVDKMFKDRPQFLYWNRVLFLEFCVLQLIRAIREGNFSLTENPAAPRGWMIAEPEVARIIQEFEEASFKEVSEEKRHHHKQTPGVQAAFKKDVLSLVPAIEEMGNSFQEDSTDLLVLDSKEIMDETVVTAVREVVSIGQDQYKAFLKERFQERTKPIKRLVEKKIDAPQVEPTITDGAVTVQMLKLGMAAMFKEYADFVFTPYILEQLEAVQKVGVVWDAYREDSLKSTARERRGTGFRRRVTASSKLPKNWKSFLHVSDNKLSCSCFWLRSCRLWTLRGRRCTPPMVNSSSVLNQQR